MSHLSDMRSALEIQRGPAFPKPAEARPAEDVVVTLDGQRIEVPSGTSLLEAARRVGIHIPTLCHHEDLCAAGVCRLCVVEVEGQRTLQAACTYPVTSPLVVRTHTPKVRQARRHVLELLLSEHCGDCATCARNLDCELQELAKTHGVSAFRFGRTLTPRHAVDRSSVSIVRDMNKCVLCRRCVATCTQLQGVSALSVVGRGDRSRISTFLDTPLADAVCINCGQCTNRCPTGALTERDETEEVWAALEDPSKHVIIQTAPSPRAAIGECFGLPPGTALTYELNTGLRRVGFDRVFDTNFTADLTIIEEGTELLLRLKRALVDKDPEARLPQFTSCSPGWVKYLEHFYPELLPHLSSAKSPQQMFGAVLKTYYAELHGIDPKDIVSVALMPCTAKKFECSRPEMNASGHRDVDYGLTTRELGKMLRQAGVDLTKLPKSHFDDPFGDATGSGVVFAATGGVMEAAIRSVVELVCGVKVENLFDHANVIPVRGFEAVKYAELPIKQVGPVPGLLAHLVPDWRWLEGKTLKVAVCHGTANARRVLEDIEAGGRFSQCHFIEFMACPGGCLGGGGQPLPTSPAIRAARAKAIYAEDAKSVVRKSHENPAVLKLYEQLLTDGPCGEKSHHLLHTHYTARSRVRDGIHRSPNGHDD